jgi:cell division protein FtsQ
MRFLSRSRVQAGIQARARNSRRTARTARLRQALRVAAMGSAVAILLGAVVGVGMVWRSGAISAALADARSAAVAKTADLGLTVRAVLVEGRFETSRAEVLAALAVERGEPLLAFDPAAAKARLESLGWVREASVARVFPGTISVHLVERRPLALWQRGGKLALVDDTGTVIGDGDVRRFASLPIVVGDDAAKQAPALLAMLASEPKLKSHVTAAVRVSDRRWNLRLDNGIDVRLPEDHAEAAWARLAELDRAYGILARDVIAIDLRMSDRLLLQLPPPAVKRLHEPGADT